MKGFRLARVLTTDQHVERSQLVFAKLHQPHEGHGGVGRNFLDQVVAVVATATTKGDTDMAGDVATPGHPPEEALPP
jgi:hypothetical protein